MNDFLRDIIINLFSEWISSILGSVFSLLIGFSFLKKIHNQVHTQVHTPLKKI